jgi:hypothetical protein
MADRLHNSVKGLQNSHIDDTLHLELNLLEPIWVWQPAEEY